MPYENVLHTTAYPLLSRIPAPVLEMLFFLEEKGFEAWIVRQRQNHLHLQPLNER